MCREKSLRNGVHHANAVVWGPVYRTRLTRSRRRIPRIRRRPVDGLVVVRRRSATPARRRRARAAPSRARRSSASVWSAGALPPRGARRPRTTPNDGPRLPRRRRRLRSRAASCSGRARRRRGRARTRRAAARRRARGPDRRSVCRFWGGGEEEGGGEASEARRGEGDRIDLANSFIQHSSRTTTTTNDGEAREGAHPSSPFATAAAPASSFAGRGIARALASGDADDAPRPSGMPANGSPRSAFLGKTFRLEATDRLPLRCDARASSSRTRSRSSSARSRPRTPRSTSSTRTRRPGRGRRPTAPSSSEASRPRSRRADIRFRQICARSSTKRTRRRRRRRGGKEEEEGERARLDTPAREEDGDGTDGEGRRRRIVEGVRRGGGPDATGARR